MNKVFDSIEDLISYVSNDFIRVMKNEVTEEIKDKHQEVIKDVVYNVYDPVDYPRRYENDGLLDRDNMKSKVRKIGDLIELEFENETTVSPYTYDSNRGDRLDEIIEYGTGGIYEYSQPRPFMQETQKRVDSERIVEKCLKSKLDYLK